MLYVSFYNILRIDKIIWCSNLIHMKLWYRADFTTWNEAILLRGMKRLREGIFPQSSLSYLGMTIYPLSSRPFLLYICFPGIIINIHSQKCFLFDKKLFGHTTASDLPWTLDLVCYILVWMQLRTFPKGRFLKLKNQIRSEGGTDLRR